MFNENDIYTYFMNGGKTKELYKALETEIDNAQKRINREKEAEQKEKELTNRINDARKFAVAALKDYFALVNPDVTEDIINSILDTLESVEIKVNDVKGKYDDEDWKKVWNFLFPFNFRSK